MSILPKHRGTTAFRSISAMMGKGIHKAAKISSRSPIEMIATILILSSFSYFYLFNLARTSDIFSGTSSRLYPTLVYADSNTQQLQQITRDAQGISSESVKLQLKQIVITSNSDSLNKHGSIEKFERMVHNTMVDDLVDYHSLCFQLPNGQCFSTLTETPSADSFLSLTLAFNTSTAYRQHLSQLWEQKVSTLSTPDIVSLSNMSERQDVFTWLFIITRNIVIRVKELIEVQNSTIQQQQKKILNFKKNRLQIKLTLSSSWLVIS